ncbi:MAG TPA: hypothetical protein VF870_08930 [Ignavibacteriaceae bacterium]
MKTSVIFSFLLILLFAGANQMLAQSRDGNVFIVTTFERAFPENGSANELDSLQQIMMDASYKSNPYVISYKTMSHWWGHNNRDFVQIIEVKSWDDISKAYDKSEELIMKAMPNKADREKFSKAYDKYFTGKHSDEIYREVKFNK